MSLTYSVRGLIQKTNFVLILKKSRPFVTTIVVCIFLLILYLVYLWYGRIGKMAITLLFLEIPVLILLRDCCFGAESE